MNILPKKNWHVRNKDNIAKVRRDEAEARAQEKKRQDQLQLAESEARINFLRNKTGQSKATVSTAVTSDNGVTSDHINLFADYKNHIRNTNKDLEKEQKEEREKYEKQIGYLTYLGQDTNEALKLKSWYEVLPKREEVGKNNTSYNEKDLKIKHAQDPLTLINALLPPEKHIKTNKANDLSSNSNVERIDTAPIKSNIPEKIRNKSNKSKIHKKEKKRKKEKREKRSNSEIKHKKKSGGIDRTAYTLEEEQRKKEKLQNLRKERLRREARERARQETLLGPSTDSASKQSTETKVAPTPRIVQKYNSQFNPELAKQNML